MAGYTLRMPHGALIFAQITDGVDRSDQLLADILPWLIALVAFVVVGGVVIYFVRRRLSADAGPTGDGFTLHDLRQLHAAGELSDSEFERAKAVMIGRLKSSKVAPPPAGVDPPNNHTPDAYGD